MLTLKGFSAWITIEGVGKEAKEYDVQVKDVSGRAEISCFIASEVGQRFSVNWEDEDFDDDVHGPTYGFVYADGRRIGDKRICRSGRHATGSATACVNQIVSPDGRICPFLFGQTELSDDDEALERKDLDQKIGRIILKIERVKITGSKRTNRIEVLRDRQRSGDLSIGKVHESVKQLSAEHRIVLGEPLSVQEYSKRGYTTINVDHLDEKSWATFVFEYRPLDVLKRLKIVPRSPKAKSVPLPRPCSPSPGLECVPHPPDGQASQNMHVTNTSSQLPPPIASSDPAHEFSDLPLPPPKRSNIINTGSRNDVKPNIKKEEYATPMKLETAPEDAKPRHIKHESPSLKREAMSEQESRSARVKELQATILAQQRQLGELLRQDIIANQLELEELEGGLGQGSSSKPMKRARLDEDDRKVKREISLPERAFTPGKIYDLTGDSD